MLKSGHYMLFVKPFQPSFAFQIETSGFFMKPNTELKWVKQGRIFSLNQFYVRIFCPLHTVKLTMCDRVNSADFGHANTQMSYRN